MGETVNIVRIRDRRQEVYEIGPDGERHVKRNWDLFQLAGMRTRLQNIAVRHNALEIKAEIVDVLDELEDRIRGQHG